MCFSLHQLPGKLLGPGKGKREVVYNSGKNDEREKGVIKGIVHTHNQIDTYRIYVYDIRIINRS